MRLPLVLAIVLVAGCAESPGGPCQDAADHIASCTGEQAAAPTTCDVERAEAIVTMDCDELAATGAAAKADGWWDDFLCGLGFTSYCSDSGSGSGSGSGTPMPTLRTLSGHVYRTGTFDQPVSNVYVRATREGTSETTGVWVVQGLFAVQNLAPARYRLEVAYAPTASALTTKTVDVASQTYVVLHAPVP